MKWWVRLRKGRFFSRINSAIKYVLTLDNYCSFLYNDGIVALLLKIKPDFVACHCMSIVPRIIFIKSLVFSKYNNMSPHYNENLASLYQFGFFKYLFLAKWLWQELPMPYWIAMVTVSNLVHRKIHVFPICK